MVKHVQRGRGRPPKDEDERLQSVHVRLPGGLLEALDGLVAVRIDGADRSTVIRELLADGVERAKRRKG
jgi:metal-responsive CopG/Arc/MetJ family transcriptional regulator